MKLSKNTAGFSLIEVLSSMTVFAIAAAGLVTTTMATIKSNSTSRATTIASALIQDKIEELRALDPTTNPADFTAGTHQDANNPLSGGMDGVDAIFSRSWVVNTDTPLKGLSEVIVTVSWPSATGTRLLRASTFICNSANCS